MDASNPSINCYIAPAVSTEQFISDHAFLYVVSGSMDVYDGNKQYKIKAGEYMLAKRNHLARYSKHPPENGPFKKVGLAFSQEFLASFAREYAYTAAPAESKGAVFKITPHPLLGSFIQSLIPYLELNGKEYQHFLFLKQKEIMLILLKVHPELKDILFDINEPGKIDLEAFMNKNYKFNVSMQRFSYLTGRSLSAFKKDFEKIFHKAPGKWLQERRLEEAHYLIATKGVAPSDVYIEVGFEDLSHFSFAFKKMYGVSPNQLKKKSSSIS